MKKLLIKANEAGGKLFFRTASIVPIAILAILTNYLISSLISGAYWTALILLLPILILVVLIRYLWSPKRTVSDVFEANS